LPLEAGNRAGTGSSYPLLNGYRPVPESADPFDVLATQEENADVEVRNEGTLERGVITIEQDLPLNCEIACIFGKAVSKVT